MVDSDNVEIIYSLRLMT